MLPKHFGYVGWQGLQGLGFPLQPPFPSATIRRQPSSSYLELSLPESPLQAQPSLASLQPQAVPVCTSVPGTLICCLVTTVATGLQEQVQSQPPLDLSIPSPPSSPTLKPPRSPSAFSSSPQMSPTLSLLLCLRSHLKRSVSCDLTSSSLHCPPPFLREDHPYAIPSHSAPLCSLSTNTHSPVLTPVASSLHPQAQEGFSWCWCQFLSSNPSFLASLDAPK